MIQPLDSVPAGPVTVSGGRWPAPCVVELSSVSMGLHAAQLSADLGAGVINFEEPERAMEPAHGRRSAPAAVRHRDDAPPERQRLLVVLY
jgi:hypothetical protein